MLERYRALIGLWLRRRLVSACNGDRTYGPRTPIAALLVAIVLAASVGTGLATAPIAHAADTPERGKGVTLTIAEVTVAVAGTDAALAITVGPSAAVPPKSYLRIRGLPASVTLTEGHNISTGVWAVPLAGLPNLALRIPQGLTGKAEIHASLVSLDGNVIKEARASIVIGPTGLLAAGGHEPMAGAAASVDSGHGPHAPVSGGGVHSGAPDTAPDAAHPPTAAKGPTVSSFPAQSFTMPSKTPPPAAPPKAAHTTAPAAAPTTDSREARAVLARAMKQLAANDTRGARTLFERAADLGLGEAAMRLAATYDPHELARLKPAGASPDPKLAQKWYERAAALGVRDAKLRLQRLAGR